MKNRKLKAESRKQANHAAAVLTDLRDEIHAAERPIGFAPKPLDPRVEALDLAIKRLRKTKQ